MFDQTTIKTILLAEDDGFVRRTIARMLERAGYHVLEARDGREALDQVCRNQGRIDLLFTDVMMPQLDGKRMADVAQALRPDLKVLYMSGFTHRMIVIRGILEPGLPFVNKACSLSQMLAKVREMIEDSSAALRDLSIG